MTSLFDRMIPQNKMIRVNNLTINIGSLTFEALDDEFVDKIIAKLESEISVLLLHDNSSTTENITAHGEDQSGSYLGLLEYFLLKGTLPWWAGTETGINPAIAFEFLLKQSPDSLIKMLMRVGQTPSVRRRLVYQFTEQQIRSLILILEPSEAEFIFDYHKEVVKLQQQKQLIKSEESEFKKSLWEFIVTYLIVDRGSHFNRKEFVKSNLLGIARNFNVSFEGLLNLFAASLIPGSSYLSNVDSLQAIIFEIAVDQGTRLNTKSAVDEILDIPIETPEAGIDLIRYYLTFGSFPWWSINVTAAELEELVVNMLRRYPKTVETLVKNIGHQQLSRKLIVKTFSENILHKILMTIEPENAEFIIDYIQEIKVSHNKKAIFKGEAEALKEAVWEFVLEYLLVDRGSEFNRQAFLESNINRLANRFNLSYRDLLVLMVNNIAVAHQNSARHLNLFQGLTTLYQTSVRNNSIENQQKKTYETHDDSQDVPAKLARIQRRSVNLLNVLYFWLRTGYKPWWANEFSSISPTVMLERLLKESPLEAITFLKTAGLQMKTRKRLVYQIPFQTLLQFFHLLPSGKDIIKHSEGLLLAIGGSKTVRYTDQSISERILLFSLWDSIIDDLYNFSNPIPFIRSVIINHALWFQIPVKRLVSSIKNEDAELKQLINEAYLSIAEQSSKVKSYDDELLEEWSDDNSLERILERYIKIEGKSTSESGKESVLQQGISVLIYFLVNNKLPESFKIYSHSSVNSFLKQLLLLLYKDKSRDLKNILNSADYKGENFLRIHEIFSIASTSEESSISVLLRNYLEKHILSFMTQKGSLDYNGKSIVSYVEAYISGSENLQSMEFLRQIFRYSSVSMQLAYHYKNDTVIKLINNNFTQIGWGNQTTTFLQSFNIWILELVPDQLERERLDLLFRTFNFTMIGGNVRAGSVRDYLSHLFEFLFERDYQLLLKLAARVNQIPVEDVHRNPVIANTINDIKLEFDHYVKFKHISTELREKLEKSEVSALKEISPNIDDHMDSERKMLVNESQPLLPEAAYENAKDSEIVPDTIYIRNAGLVILHPFLSTYFNRLQMLEKGDFINEEMRHRAVHLLQYLAFGTDTCEEHELVLNKILCNIPVDEPVTLGIQLTEQEKTISSELLNAVLVQWDKLKNSTPASFQASFIQRDGGLYKVEENWNLKVEQRGYDVLLSTLPWGVGMVKTSWMTDFIYVEWM